MTEMDDPLIGLTIYDTSGTTLDREDPPGASGEHSKKSRKNDSEDCFPCLPSIPDSQEKVKSAAIIEDVKTDDSSETAEQDGAEQDASSRNYWLMRLFQSSLFDMSIAIGYLFNSKDQNVQSYLGNKLFVSCQKYVEGCTILPLVIEVNAKVKFKKDSR